MRAMLLFVLFFGVGGCVEKSSETTDVTPRTNITTVDAARVAGIDVTEFVDDKNHVRCFVARNSWRNDNVGISCVKE